MNIFLIGLSNNRIHKHTTPLGSSMASRDDRLQTYDRFAVSADGAQILQTFDRCAVQTPKGSHVYRTMVRKTNPKDSHIRPRWGWRRCVTTRYKHSTASRSGAAAQSTFYKHLTPTGSRRRRRRPMFIDKMINIIPTPKGSNVHRINYGINHHPRFHNTDQSIN